LQPPPNRTHWTVVVMLSLAAALVFYSIISPDKSPKYARQQVFGEVVGLGQGNSGLVRVVLKPEREQQLRLDTSNGGAAKIRTGPKPFALKERPTPPTTLASVVGLILNATNESASQPLPQGGHETATSLDGNASATSQQQQRILLSNSQQISTSRENGAQRLTMVALGLVATVVVLAFRRTGVARRVVQAAVDATNKLCRKGARGHSIEVATSEDTEDTEDEEDLYNRVVFTASARELGYGSFGRYTYIPRSVALGSDSGASTWLLDHFDKFDV